MEEVDEVFLQESMAASAVKKAVENVEILEEYTGPNTKWHERHQKVICFLCDVLDLRDLVRDTWFRYAKCSIDIRAAAIITNAAVSLVPRAEEDIEEIMRMTAKDSYLQLMACLHENPTAEQDWPVAMRPDTCVEAVGQLAQLSTFQSL